MTCSTTSAPWSNASTPGSRTNSAPGSCACAAPSRSNAISCSASSPSPSIKYSACPRCKKLRVDQLAAQVSEKSPASQIMQEALTAGFHVPVDRLKIKIAIESTPQLARKSTEEAIQDRRFAEAVYRGAIADGAMEGVQLRDPLDDEASHDEGR